MTACVIVCSSGQERGEERGSRVVTLGRRIRAGREGSGLTVRGFARRIAVAPPFVLDIETDRRRPGPEVLGRIADVLNIPLAELRELDPRVAPEVKAWMDQEPRVSSLLSLLCEHPDRDAVMDQIERWLRDSGRCLTGGRKPKDG